MERILICLTAYSVGARWAALYACRLASVRGEDGIEEPHEPRVLLRTSHSCFQCVVDQALTQPGYCLVIL